MKKLQKFGLIIGILLLSCSLISSTEEKDTGNIAVDVADVPVLTNISAPIPQMISNNSALYRFFGPEILGQENIGYSISYVVMGPGESMPPRSLTSNEVEFFLEGKGIVIIDNNTYNVQAGDAIFIPKNLKRKWMNIGDSDLIFLTIVEPPWTPDCEVRYEE